MLYHCAITPEQQSIAEAQFDKTILALAAQLQIHDFLPDADKAKILERVEAIKAQELLKTQERETEQELNQQTQKSWDMSL